MRRHRTNRTPYLFYLMVAFVLFLVYVAPPLLLGAIVYTERKFAIVSKGLIDKGVPQGDEFLAWRLTLRDQVNLAQLEYDTLYSYSVNSGMEVRADGMFDARSRKSKATNQKLNQYTAFSDDLQQQFDELTNALVWKRSARIIAAVWTIGFAIGLAQARYLFKEDTLIEGSLGTASACALIASPLCYFVSKYLVNRPLTI